MKDGIVLGIDCGGTHTDAALLRVETGKATLLAAAKTGTRHDDLPGSISEVIELLETNLPKGIASFKDIQRVTLGTTLEVNALVQNRADQVGLALSAGPGLDPIHFALGNHVCIVPGGLDHRGMEVKKLFTEELAREAAAWPAQGVAAVACVGKFSPRNPQQEITMGDVAGRASGLPVTLGHNLSGKLNFPRRVATAYYNAAVGRLHQNFLNAVESALKGKGITARLRLLKADGGAIPFNVSRAEPVQSILSGPAASVMGVLAMWDKAAQDCALLLDMGGTTTDIAMFYNGSPVVDRDGMKLQGRRTLVRSLASISIGVGGDSLLHATNDARGIAVHAGPERVGPAMAFGGDTPTLLDALNVLDGEEGNPQSGDAAASHAGMSRFAQEHGLPSALEAASQALADALANITRATYNLVENINSRPIYTLAALKAAREARPTRACLVGGPAERMRGRLEKALGLPVEIAPHPQVANAIGAALTIPTASLEIYADTGKGQLTAPALNYQESIPKSWTLAQSEDKALELLRGNLLAEGGEDAHVEVVEGDLFATLDDYGRGARDMRVVCQARPGILARLAPESR